MKLSKFRSFFHINSVGRFILMVSLLTSINGCVAIPIFPYFPLHKQYTEQDLAVIKPGATRKSEVIELLGPANILENNNYYLTELFSRGKGMFWGGVMLKGSNMFILPLPIVFLNTPVELMRVLIEFNEHGVVQRIETTGNKLSRKEDLLNNMSGSYANFIDHRVSLSGYEYSSCKVMLIPGDNQASASLECCGRQTQKNSCNNISLHTNKFNDFNSWIEYEEKEPLSLLASFSGGHSRKAELLDKDYIVIRKIESPENSKSDVRKTDQIASVSHLPLNCVLKSGYPNSRERNQPRALFITRDGDLGVECEYPGVSIFDVASGQLKWHITPDAKEVPNERQIKRLSISPDMKRLEIATFSYIYFFDLPPLFEDLAIKNQIKPADH